MVGSRSALAALLIILASVTHAQIAAHLEPRRVVLGEPVLLRLTGPDLDLSQLDLTLLEGDFEIYARAASRSEVGGRLRSTLELTLYARRAGVLTVPPLGAPRRHSAPMTVEVLTAHGDAPPVEIIAGIEPDDPMVREPVRLTLRIRDDGTRQWQQPQPIGPGGVHFTPRLERSRALEHHGLIEHEYHWSLLALKPGSVTVALGMLEAFRLGKRLRYPAPTLSFRATPAPAFLPSHVPVGRPRLETGPLPAKLLVGRPATWRWTLDAPGLGKDGVATWLAIASRTPDGMRFYPVRVDPTVDGRWEIILTFVAERAGALILPPFTLPYFEPRTQRLEALRVGPATLTGHDPAIERINRLGLATLAMLLSGRLAWALWPWLRRWWRKRIWLARLRAASDPAALAHVLRGQGPRPAPTLRRWASAVSCDGEMVEALERARFAPQAPHENPAALQHAWEATARRLPLAWFT